MVEDNDKIDPIESGSKVFTDCGRRRIPQKPVGAMLH